VHSLRRTYHRLKNHFGRTRWYSKVTSVKWNLVSVRLEIVLILAQERCMVCVDCTAGMEMISDAPDNTLGDVGRVEACFSLDGDSVNLGAR
jgi:hypothetical protein